MSENSTSADPFPFHRDNVWSKILTLTFAILPLLALVGAILFWWDRGIGWFHVAALVGMWTFAGLGISLGYHRMLTHRAFTARAPTRLILLIAASMSMQGPPADWAATHIRHHAKADREGDPHSPLEGFWHAHFGWLLRDRFVRNGLAHEKLMMDPIVRFVQHTWWIWATLGILIPGVIGYFVMGPWGILDGIIWGGLARVFIGHHITWSVNSIAHMFGTKPFKTTDQARNNWIVALFSWGEGWHNNHHAFPRSAYIGLRWWQLDPGKFTIRVLRVFGQIKSVWLPSKEEQKASKKKAKKAPEDALPESN